METNLRSQTPSMLSQVELSARIGVSPATLEKWRMRGEGPPSVKLNPAKNGMVRYRLKDVEEWELSLQPHKPIAANVAAELERHAGA